MSSNEPTTDATVLELLGGPLDGALSLCRTGSRFLDIQRGATIKDGLRVGIPAGIPDAHSNRYAVPLPKHARYEVFSYMRKAIFAR